MSIQKNRVTADRPGLGLYHLTSKNDAAAEDGSCVAAVVAAIDLLHAKSMAVAREDLAGSPTAGGTPRLWFTGGAAVRTLARQSAVVEPGILCAQHKGLL